MSTAKRQIIALIFFLPTGDVVDVAVGAGEFTTLAKIVTDLGLVDTLKNAEALTIFAPNDKAFAKLPAGTLESLTPEQVCNFLHCTLLLQNLMFLRRIRGRE